MTRIVWVCDERKPSSSSLSCCRGRENERERERVKESEKVRLEQTGGGCVQKIETLVNCNKLLSRKVSILC